MTDRTSDRAAPPVEVAVEEEAAWKRRLTITVAPQRVAEARRREQRKLAKSLRVKGFRKGRVPPHVVEQKYGPLIDQRTLSALVEEAYREAVRAKQLQPIGDPAIADVHYSEGEPLTFRAEIEIMPEVRLSRLGAFRIQRPRVEARDQEVDEVIERLRRERAVLQPVERAARDGDVVSVRIGEPDSEEPGEAAQADEEGRPYRFELGAGLAIADVEAAIKSLEPGERGDFEVRYPDDFEDADLAGSVRSLHVELVDVKAKRLPELDDAFAAEVGDFDSLAALRDAVRTDIARHHEDEADLAVRDRLVDALIEANPFEVPPALVDRYLDQIVEAPEGVDSEEMAKARKALSPAAEREIKRQLILDRVIEDQGLEATEQDLAAQLEEIAGKRNLSAEETRRTLARQKRLEGLRRQIAVDKAFEFLASESTIE